MKEKIKKSSSPFRRDRHIYYTFFIIFLFYISAHYFFGLPIILSTYFTSVIKASFLTGTLVLIFHFMNLLMKKEKHPLFRYYEIAKYPIINANETINILLILFLLSISLSLFTNTKEFLPNINKFYLDSELSSIDYYLHLNQHPWEITHYFFNSSVSSGIINLLYNLWFFFVWIYLIYFCYSTRNSELRKNSIICFILCWTINGNILATLFSSAGPCFYRHLYENEKNYGQLFNILTEQNLDLINNGSFLKIWALSTQEMLWSSYSSNSSILGGGISAMPSMHVSITTLIAISLSNYNKKLGAICWIYLVAIQVGSVHLGWHYAIDGYVSILATTLIWYAVSKWTKKAPIKDRG